MADDKARADKVAAARKKAAQKKAAEVKAKKGKAATASTEAADELKDDDTPAEEGISTPAEPEEKEPDSAPVEPVDEPTPAAALSSESTAALEAKLAELEKECAAAKSARDEAQLMSEALEKKVASLEMLRAEDESQISRLEKNLADARNETADARDKLQKTEEEVLRLSKKEAQDSGGTDNDHLDELEDEERQKLEARIRELEAENTDLRRGIWVERRKELQPGMDEAFTNVDLGGSGSPSAQRKQSGLGGFFTTGLNALTGASGQHEPDEDGFLDDDDDFDEEAFRKAQDEAAKARIERIKDVKRGLSQWATWRLDLVDARTGGGEGIGEIFEV
ncbi:unnamed protein product [Discula destructiva]